MSRISIFFQLCCLDGCRTGFKTHQKQFFSSGIIRQNIFLSAIFCVAGVPLPSYLFRSVCFFSFVHQVFLVRCAFLIHLVFVESCLNGFIFVSVVTMNDFFFFLHHCQLYEENSPANQVLLVTCILTDLCVSRHLSLLIQLYSLLHYYYYYFFIAAFITLLLLLLLNQDDVIYMNRGGLAQRLNINCLS